MTGIYRPYRTPLLTLFWVNLHWCPELRSCIYVCIYFVYMLYIQVVYMFLGKFHNKISWKPFRASIRFEGWAMAMSYANGCLLSEIILESGMVWLRKLFKRFGLGDIWNMDENDSFFLPRELEKKENNVKDRKYQSNILQIPLFINAGGWKVGKPVNYLEMWKTVVF